MCWFVDPSEIPPCATWWFMSPRIRATISCNITERRILYFPHVAEESVLSHLLFFYSVFIALILSRFSQALFQLGFPIFVVPDMTEGFSVTFHAFVVPRLPLRVFWMAFLWHFLSKYVWERPQQGICFSFSGLLFRSDFITFRSPQSGQHSQHRYSKCLHEFL